ncbi:hypothetical protein TetV_146 [Tetraselmis virus 1]|uniref:Uncharacterized protein n=1 Tax=Tetraselmis virus 1 TaxID=2060617 RepID=A0A2P0VMV3_9VIRU|nr:hypothetical protein QJ968_gp146 [Tetraselmis virus 1]AUF82238.1 hypothetical protein TetV_146 [Tetraselmis virus 1]
MPWFEKDISELFLNEMCDDDLNAIEKSIIQTVYRDVILNTKFITLQNMHGISIMFFIPGKTILKEDSYAIREKEKVMEMRGFEDYDSAYRSALASESFLEMMEKWCKVYYKNRLRIIMRIQMRIKLAIKNRNQRRKEMCLCLTRYKIPKDIKQEICKYVK